MPTVSIITPCYNSEKFFQETIDSVLNQNFQDWEWLVTDDGSSDRSIEMLQAVKDPRIRIFRAEKRGGAGKARNNSLSHSSGRYITFLDSDDCWKPEFLEEMLKFMQKNNAELAYCTYSRCDENMVPQLADFRANRIVTYANTLRTCRLSLLATVYDRQKAGIEYFPTRSLREDHIMWLNLLKRIPEGIPYDRNMASYRMHANSVSRRKERLIQDQYNVYRQHMKYSVPRSIFYTIHWAINGIIKYSPFFNRS